MAPTNGDHIDDPPPPQQPANPQPLTQNQINEALDNRIGQVNDGLHNRIRQLEASLQQMELRGKPKGGRPPTWGKNTDNDTTWSSFLSRFGAWCISEDVMRDPGLCKSYLYQSIMGTAANMIVAIKPGTAFYDSSTFQQYADKLDLIFRPASEAALAKSVYEDRKQGEEESVQSYFCQKKNL